MPASRGRPAGERSAGGYRRRVEGSGRWDGCGAGLRAVAGAVAATEQDGVRHDGDGPAGQAGCHGAQVDDDADGLPRDSLPGEGEQQRDGQRAGVRVVRPGGTPRSSGQCRSGCGTCSPRDRRRRRTVPGWPRPDRGRSAAGRHPHRRRGPSRWCRRDRPPGRAGSGNRVRIGHPPILGSSVPRTTEAGWESTTATTSTCTSGTAAGS